MPEFDTLLLEQNYETVQQETEGNYKRKGKEGYAKGKKIKNDFFFL